MPTRHIQQLLQDGGLDPIIESIVDPDLFRDGLQLFQQGRNAYQQQGMRAFKDPEQLKKLAGTLSGMIAGQLTGGNLGIEDLQRLIQNRSLKEMAMNLDLTNLAAVAAAGAVAGPAGMVASRALRRNIPTITPRDIQNAANTVSREGVQGALNKVRSGIVQQVQQMAAQKQGPREPSPAELANALRRAQRQAGQGGQAGPEGAQNPPVPESPPEEPAEESSEGSAGGTEGQPPRPTPEQTPRPTPPSSPAGAPSETPPQAPPPLSSLPGHGGEPQEEEGPLPQVSPISGGGVPGTPSAAPSPAPPPASGESGGESGGGESSREPAEEENQPSEQALQSELNRDQQGARGGQGQGEGGNEEGEGEEEGEGDGEGEESGGTQGLPKIGSKELLKLMVDGPGEADVLIGGLFGPTGYVLIHTFFMLFPFDVGVLAFFGGAAADKWEWPDLDTWPGLLVIVLGELFWILGTITLLVLLTLPVWAIVALAKGEWSTFIDFIKLFSDADILKYIFDFIKSAFV